MAKPINDLKFKDGSTYGERNMTKTPEEMMKEALVAAEACLSAIHPTNRSKSGSDTLALVRKAIKNAPTPPAPIAAQTEQCECDHDLAHHPTDGRSGSDCTVCDCTEFKLKTAEQVDAARELEQLRQWKESAIKLLPMQEWGQELGLRLGESIHEHILPALKELRRLRAASLKQERCPSGAQSGAVTESQRCIECGQTIPAGSDCFYYRETGIFVHAKCPASFPLETPAAETELVQFGESDFCFTVKRSTAPAEQVDAARQLSIAEKLLAEISKSTLPIPLKWKAAIASYFAETTSLESGSDDVCQLPSEPSEPDSQP